MNKLIKIIVSCLLIASLSGCSNAKQDGQYQAGTYTASSKGFGGDVVVTIETDNNTITNVSIQGDDETPTIGQVALETLENSIIENQSEVIDIVTGATVTSNAVINATKVAIEMAKGETGEKVTLNDGVYVTSAESYGWLGLLKSQITIENNQITDITILEESDSATGEVSQSAFELFIPRLIEAQSLAVDAVSGATVTSNAIRSTVEQAITEAGGLPYQWYDEIEKSEETIIIEDYDVIVVGLGGSGILSYATAAQQGASVFGIEKTAKLGGQSATTTGPMVINSEAEIYKDVNFANPDEVYDVWMDYVESDEKSDIIYEAVYNSGKYLDYYMDNFDFEFAGMILSFANPSWSQFWTRYVGEEGQSNIFGPNKTYQFERAMEIAKSLNDKNDYQLELCAEELIFDSNEIVGVKATSYDGKKYEIYGDSVILATGGFIGNQELVEQYLTTAPIQNIAYMVNDGAGIEMGLSAGGETYMMGVDPVIHILQIPYLIKNNALTSDEKAILSALALVKGEMAVNVYGEPLDMTLTESMIPEYKYYNIYSQDQIDQFKESGLTENFASATSHFMGQGGSFEVNTPINDMDKIIEVGIETNNIIKANSISELAQQIGCDEATLANTLNNQDTTYYAVKTVGYSYGTVGGLDVDVNMNVLNADNQPIANLFAVGNDSMGVENIEGKPYTPWGGQAQSWTFVSGKLAGEAAAKHALSK